MKIFRWQSSYFRDGEDGDIIVMANDIEEARCIILKRIENIIKDRTDTSKHKVIVDEREHYLAILNDINKPPMIIDNLFNFSDCIFIVGK